MSNANDDKSQKATLLAVQTARAAIENGVSKTEGESLLIQASGQPRSWVQRCSSDTQKALLMPAQVSELAPELVQERPQVGKCIPQAPFAVPLGARVPRLLFDLLLSVEVILPAGSALLSRFRRKIALEAPGHNLSEPHLQFGAQAGRRSDARESLAQILLATWLPLPPLAPGAIVLRLLHHARARRRPVYQNNSALISRSGGGHREGCDAHQECSCTARS